MPNTTLSYRVRPNGALWHWEVLAGTASLAQGDEKSSVAARSRAMLFSLERWSQARH
jgi:hypothetical protein